MNPMKLKFQGPSLAILESDKNHIVNIYQKNFRSSPFFNNDNDLKNSITIIERLLCAKHYAKYVIGLLSLFKEESHLSLRRQILQRCQKIGLYSCLSQMAINQ